MKRTLTIKNNYEFRRLYSKGSTAASSLLVIYCRKNRYPNNRLGLTVGKKIGKAVTRNLIRRRIREIYRLNELSLATGYDIVIAARTRSAFVDYSTLEKDLLKLFEKAGLLVKENG